MNAKLLSFPIADAPLPAIPRMCWPCICIWCGMPAFWVFVFWVVLHGHG